MKVNFKKLTNTAHVPTRGSVRAAGYDLYADIAEPVMIPPHTTVKFPTNIAVELPEDTFGGIYARSGMATKRNLRPANAVGILDCDYRGNIIVALHNDSDFPQIVEVGERIAQLIIQPYLNVEFNKVDNLSETERGNSGFGSTGTK